jgi:glutamate-1-semialdehyde 2,1-aminomutase
VWAQLDARAAEFVEGIGSAVEQAGVPIRQNRAGKLITTFFARQPVRDWQSAKASDTSTYTRYFHNMLEQGIYLAPSQFEAAFTSTSHEAEIVERTDAAAKTTMKQLS